MSDQGHPCLLFWWVFCEFHKKTRQTGQTQISLLPQKRSGQDLLCLLFWRVFCEFQPWWPTLYLRTERENFSNFLEHLLYLIFPLIFLPVPSWELAPPLIVRRRSLAPPGVRCLEIHDPGYHCHCYSHLAAASVYVARQPLAGPPLPPSYVEIRQDDDFFSLQA